VGSEDGFREEKDLAGKLKPLDVERETRPGKYADGDGLYLVVKGATSKNWIYRYTKDGKERWLGLGSVKDVSLKDARLARDAARLRVKGDRSTPGVDIVQEKRAAREEAKVGNQSREGGVRPPACVSLKTSTKYGLSAFQSMATRGSRGRTSFSNSSRLAPSSGAIRLMPVTLPPGRARLARVHSPTGRPQLSLRSE
jgi:hypothetical protein